MFTAHADPVQTAEDVFLQFDVRIPGETPHSFAKFQHYLTLGPDRSLRTLSRLAREGAFSEGVPLRGYALSNLEDLSSRNNWAARAAEYDRAVLLRRRGEWEEKRAKYLESMWGVSLQAFQRAADMLDAPLEVTRKHVGANGKAMSVKERNGWTVRDAAILARTAALLGEAFLSHTSADIADPSDVSHVPSITITERESTSAET